jgi:hypothetical protein
VLARLSEYDTGYFYWAFVPNLYDRLVLADFHVVSCHGFDYYHEFHDFVRCDFEDGFSTPRQTESRL